MSSGSSKKKVPLKKRASHITAVRLPVKVVCKIDSLVGKGNRSRFIAAAIEKELKRQVRLAHIEKGEGFIPDDLDALDFVNRLRSWNGRGG